MTEEERIDLLERILSRQMQWIGAADSRITILLGVSTAMLGVLATNAQALKAWTIPEACAVTLTVALLAACLVSIFIAVIPRTSGPKQSLLFFQGIADRDVTQFQTAIETLTAFELTKDLASQTHRNAQIASTKFRWVTRALISLVLSITPWSIALALIYLHYP